MSHFFCAVVLHDGPEETAIREVWEETGVRAGTHFEDNDGLDLSSFFPPFQNKYFT